MPKFVVTIQELANYELAIEAESGEAAMAKAEAEFVKRGVAKCECEVLERDPIDWRRA